MTTNKFLQPGVCVLLKQWDSRAEIIILVNLFHIFKIPFHKNAFGGLLLYVSLNSNGDTIKRALHYLFNWAWFLEINKLCNVATKNLRFSTNRKFISLNWKVWTYSNFQLIESENEWTAFSTKGKTLKKLEVSNKFHQLVEKCNNLHVSISCVVQLIDFN